MEDADGVIDLEPTPKKAKLSPPTLSALKRKFEDGPSPSKRRRLEEDGVVIMDGPDETLELTSSTAAILDADCIVIDH